MQIMASNFLAKIPKYFTRCHWAIAKTAKVENERVLLFLQWSKLWFGLLLRRKITLTGAS
jgi:hypothetical protein